MILKLPGRAVLLLILLFMFAGCEWGMMDIHDQDAIEEDGEADIESDIMDVEVDVPIDTPVDPPTDGVDDGEDILEVELPPPCTEGDYQCTAGGAERCTDGAWVPVGACPLGCDEGSEACYVPSNIPPDLIDESAGSPDLSLGNNDLYINTDTGEIRDSDDTVIRAPGTGYDAATGTTFQVVDQGGEAPDIGVFVVGELNLPNGKTLFGEGANALAIAASGNITIGGVINMCAHGQEPGPGGWAGGNPGEAGSGMCPGSPGAGGNTNCASSHYCSAGSGGGGYGGAGGNGADASTEFFAGGSGGGPCGSPEISSLIGGSGGAGGGIATPGTSLPGPGGGGGGAVQLVSATNITFGGSGGIHAGGDGGGTCDRGGGAGGGAGGAALIEAPDVDVAPGALIAANGGGGGAGDCT